MKLFSRIPVFAMVFCFASPLHAALADGVKAIVNDTVITYAQVDDFTAPAAETLRRQYADQPDVFRQKFNELIGDGLEQLVERQLILTDFDVEGYKLPDSVVDQLVSERVRERFGDRTTLMKTLESQGMTLEQFRKDVREQYIVAALRSKNISQEIVISPYKIENYYLTHQDDFKIEDEIKLRMIVLNKSSVDDSNTLNLAHEVETKIKEGATFQEMATVYSQGSQQHQAGDWGWVERSVLRKELADVAFTLKPGEVSDVIETPESDYLMLVEQVRPAHVKSLGEIRDDIEKTLRTREQARIEKQWIDGLRKKTFVVIFP